MTNVLNSQRDAIVIVSCEQASNEPVSESTSLSIEFSNVKSEELFGINLADSMTSEDSDMKNYALVRLALPQFVPFDK